MSRTRFDFSDALATAGLIILTVGLVRISVTLTLIVWGIGLIGIGVAVHRDRQKATIKDEGAQT